MPPKAAGGSKGASAKKAKPVFDAFERVCQFTSVSLADAASGSRAASTAPSQPSAKASITPPAAGADGDAAEEGGYVAEFTASALTILPPLPRTAVALHLQFRVTVPLTVGDVILVHLPKFKGPAAQQFSLERVPSTALSGGGVGSPGGGGGGGSVTGGGGGGTAASEEVCTCTHFRAYWSGDTAKVTTPVHQLVFKRGKKDAPPKQVLLLQCTSAVNADTHLAFCVPQSLGLVSPDKLAANSPKIKIEGLVVREASGRRILKQVILSSSEVRKRTVVEELAVFDQCIAHVAQEGRLQTADRHLGEQLSIEEVDQLTQAAQYRRRYPLPMPWTIADELAVPYDAAGGFVKRIIQNAIKGVKDFDPLAIHREVARNWGVKVAAVVVLDDLLTIQWGGLYPGLPRSCLFASCLLTMEPEDIGRTFPGLPSLPERSIAEDLASAFRTRSTLQDAPSPTAAAAAAAAAAATSSRPDAVGGMEVGGLPDRCGACLDRWAAVLTALLPASFVAEESSGLGSPPRSSTVARSKAPSAAGGTVAESHRTSKAATAATEAAAAAATTTTATLRDAAADGSARVEFQLPAQEDEGDDDDDDRDEHSGAASARGRRRRSSGTDGAGYSAGALATLQPPPTLYIGYRDVPFDVQRSLREMERGEWFVLPCVVVARQSLPYTATTAGVEASSTAIYSSTNGGRVARDDDGEDGEDGGGGGGTGAAAVADESAASDGADSDGVVVSIPDNAVVVELHHVVEALELADLSFAPHNRAWLLPLITSCRVVSVEEDQHDVLHIVLDVQGSLVGQVNDPLLPQSDRSVATMILSRYLRKAEQTEAYVSSLSSLALLCARRNERRRLHPPTLIRAQYLSYCAAALRAAIAKQHVEESESVEWQVRTHEAQMIEEGVVKPAAWEAIPKKYMLAVEQFFLGRSRTVTKMEEGTLSVDLTAYTIDYAGKGPRALRRVVQRTYITHEALSTETFAMLHEREEQFAKQITTLDAKLGLNTTATATAGAGAAATAGANGGAKTASKK
ncbi:hypothetical protein NESM_000373100 [Novymonas esmeraldas]|uniref:Uncharacterized protein n=1 Tax=Novymonas esmeraldas TaxID=1808958 RepID=A0AAW0ENR6_9TRYP